MKKYLYLLFAVAVTVSCSNRNEIPSDLIGGWKRDFYPVPDKHHVVKYTFYKDSVHYDLMGDVVNTNYTLIKDSFISEENRFIGHDRKGDFYVVFVENQTDSILLFKEKVISLEEGLKFKKPAPDFKENHSQGWNRYSKD